MRNRAKESGASMRNRAAPMCASVRNRARTAITTGLTMTWRGGGRGAIRKCAAARAVTWVSSCSQMSPTLVTRHDPNTLAQFFGVPQWPHVGTSLHRAPGSRSNME